MICRENSNSDNIKKADFGIVTFFAKNNFGAVLQAYALQKKISDLGFCAETVNYQDSSKSQGDSGKNSIKAYLKFLKSVGLGFRDYFKARNMYGSSSAKFDAFRRIEMRIGKNRLYPFYLSRLPCK